MFYALQQEGRHTGLRVARSSVRRKFLNVEQFSEAYAEAKSIYRRALGYFAADWTWIIVLVALITVSVDAPLARHGRRWPGRLMLKLILHQRREAMG